MARKLYSIADGKAVVLEAFHRSARHMRRYETPASCILSSLCPVIMPDGGHLPVGKVKACCAELVADGLLDKVGASTCWRLSPAEADRLGLENAGRERDARVGVVVPLDPGDKLGAEVNASVRAAFKAADERTDEILAAWHRVELSEGEAARRLGVHRVEARKLRDDWCERNGVDFQEGDEPQEVRP